MASYKNIITGGNIQLYQEVLTLLLQRHAFFVTIHRSLCNEKRGLKIIQMHFSSNDKKKIWVSQFLLHTGYQDIISQ